MFTTNFKKVLRDFYNEIFSENIKNIKQTYSVFGVNNANDAYKELNKEYKKLIELQEKEKRKSELEKATIKIKKQFEEKKEKALTKLKEKKEEKKYYEKNITIINYDVEAQNNFYEILKKSKGKSLIITIYDKKGGNILTTRYETIPNTDKEFIDWWKSKGIFIIWVNSDETIYTENPDAVIYIYEGNKKIKAEKIKQYFKEGNVNCLLKPIFKWAEECKENSKSDSAKSRYNAIIKKLNKISDEVGNNGVSESEMIRISNDAQIDISIENAIVVGDNKYIVESKANKKPLKHFIMRNTKFNHVDINEFLYLNNIEFVSREQLYEIKNKLEEEKIYYEFKSDLNGIKSINTLEKTWCLSNEFMELIREMEMETGLNECYIDDIDDKELSEFVKMGTHYNATIDFVDNPKLNKDIKHIDMKNAYANYKMCDYYEGFLGKITDWRKTNKIEGVGLYQISNLNIGDKLQFWNNKMKIYYDNNIYPSAELNWLKNNGATFDITYGCWGVKTIDFDMNDYDFLFEKYDGIKGYAKYVGMCDSHYLTKKFSCYGDEELASTLSNSVYFKNNVITIEYPKSHNYHLGHFTAFILSYQRIQMLNQLLNMNQNNLIRVCVDGIYYTGEDPIINKIFSQKEKMTFENIAGNSYISNINFDILDWNCGEYKKTYQKELYIGEGGNGKTHKNLIDKGLQKVLYLAPSWKLAEKKRQEYNVHSEVWANILTSDPEKYGSIKRRYNVFIIDEVSMMTEENKLNIFNKFDNIKLIFCGDIGFQAGPFSLSDCIPVKEMNKDGFDIIYQENVNYRYKCSILKEIIYNVRQMIIYNRPNADVNTYVKSMFKKINNDEVKQMYNINDMILSRSHEIKDKYTDMFKHMNKWYITKNTRLYKNGQIIIGDKPDTTCELRHSYTIHSIQGETAEEKLFINMEKSYDKRLLYTAISRARRAEQIILIV